MLTLASDFGSPYPAAMKGVLCRYTDARLVDVAHDLPRQDVRAAAFWLRETLPFFPPAVHLVVVDPGVGTDRAALVCTVADHVVVAPDNGVCRPVVRRLAAGAGDEDGTEPRFFVVNEDAVGPAPHGDAPAGWTKSATFHGRDVFAPAAGAVHERGTEALVADGTLEPVDAADVADLSLPEATVEGDRAEGEVLVVDDFGNAVTSVPGSFLAGADRLAANGVEAPVVSTFAAVPAGERLATVGSHGNVELDVNRGRGDEAFGLAPGDRVTLEVR